MTDKKKMAPRVLEYKLTAALRTLQEVAQALESVLEIRGAEGWHSYDKTDAATHPAKAGGYLVTLKGPTGHLSVEVRPFEAGKGFAGDWSRYSVQAWRSIPKPYEPEGASATALSCD